jgi:hypothetical protein
MASDKGNPLWSGGPFLEQGPGHEHPPTWAWRSSPRAYEEDFKKFPQSRVKVLTRKVYRDGIGSLWVNGTRVASDDSKETPHFLELRKVDYALRDGLLFSGRYCSR